MDGEEKAPRLSCVVVTHEMRREAPRTLASLAPGRQRDVAADDYEVVVVDNTRDPAKRLRREEVEAHGPNFRLLAIEDPKPSPAAALNAGAALARGGIIAAMIDGARMASPGCVAWTLRAFAAFPDAAVIVPSWHIGPDVQNRSVARGYNQVVEDGLLAAVDWMTDGYELFKICERLDPSSEGHAWFSRCDESNLIAVDRATWDRLGGYEEAFTSPGGGAVNLDFMKRVAEEESRRMVTLLGEGTFHQIHGGVSTNVVESEHPWIRIAAEYRAVRGRDYAQARYEPTFLGTMGPQAKALLARSPNIFTHDHAAGRPEARYNAYLYASLAMIATVVAPWWRPRPLR